MTSNPSPTRATSWGFLLVGLLIGVSLSATVRSRFRDPDRTSQPTNASRDVLPSVTPKAPAAPRAQGIDPRLHDLHNGVCPIMGGDVQDFQQSSIVYNGLLVHFCCLVCYEEFLEDPLANLRRMKQEFSVDVPEGMLTPEANPSVVWIHNAKSPISGTPASHDAGEEVIVVHRGIAFFLSSRTEIGAFLDAPDETVRQLSTMGYDVPLQRLAR